MRFRMEEEVSCPPDSHPLSKEPFSPVVTILKALDFA